MRRAQLSWCERMWAATMRWINCWERCSVTVHSAAGFALVTSRASYEMVAKAAACNIAVLAAVSAPTSLAVQQAQLSGLTLVGFVQPGRHVIYTHAQRIVEEI